MMIAYVGPFAFPSSNANALRVKGMAEALVLAGHDVHVCSGEPGQQGSTGMDLPDRIQVSCAHEYETGLFSGVHRGLRGLFLGDATLRWLQSLERKPDAIVLYGTPLGYLLRLLPFCKKQGIPLLLDVVEWYDPRHLPGGALGPFALANELSMRYVAKKAAGMFTISRYLQEHFTRQGCKTLRVPPLFSFHQARPVQFRDANGMLNLCYAGSPGGKEDIHSVFHGLQLAHDAGIPFLMHVVGLTASQFAAAFGMQELSIIRNGESVRFYGRVENAEARRIVSSCDFQVLLRKDERFTRAGFPSKVAESLCLGTPIIGNLSSNLDEFLADGENAIIVSESEANAFCEALTRAAHLPEGKLELMKRAAGVMADKHFRPQGWSVAVSDWINEVSCK